MTTNVEQIQQAVQEIAEVLTRQSGKSIREVWEEALSLRRVRYETDTLPEVEGALESDSRRESYATAQRTGERWR